MLVVSRIPEKAGKFPFTKAFFMFYVRNQKLLNLIKTLSNPD
ncbi:hypothetical protein HOLDEFILI_01495 [Holdemania filiformis DSM 12042]|uniref:Uncharacterized protein n=1 Tax=Holdemania filiformis DSM 12042 TaxID=545696 RepID=B9Y6Q2_9FIRM|nr:hypothetical protein HOLDEFILI_01495 [Holdemania filiformis DSM 12042]